MEQVFKLELNFTPKFVTYVCNTCFVLFFNF